MKRHVLVVIAFLGTAVPVTAQVVIEEPAPKVQVEIDDLKPSAVQLTMLRPLPGTAISDSVLRVEGIARNARLQSLVRLRLGSVEQFVSVGVNGRFGTTFPLRTMGLNQLIVAAPGTSDTVSVLYHPPLTSLTIFASEKGPLLPGSSTHLMATACFQNGSIRDVSSDVAWLSSDEGVGTVDRKGIATAVNDGQATITAEYKDRKASFLFQVAAPDPPLEPTEGLVNITVSDPKVLLRIWDNATEDGDSVTVILNGKVVADCIEIFHEPKTFTLTLQPGQNVVEILAENEGRDPPNTASFSFVGED